MKGRIAARVRKHKTFICWFAIGMARSLELCWGLQQVQELKPLAIFYWLAFCWITSGIATMETHAHIRCSHHRQCLPQHNTSQELPLTLTSSVLENVVGFFFCFFFLWLFVYFFSKHSFCPLLGYHIILVFLLAPCTILFFFACGVLMCWVTKMLKFLKLEFYNFFLFYLLFPRSLASTSRNKFTID